MKHRRASLPSKLLSLDLLKPPALEKGRRYERILAHRIDCQRAISPPVQQKGEATTKGVYGWPYRLSTGEFRISTVVFRWPSHPSSAIRCRVCPRDSAFSNSTEPSDSERS